MSLVWDCLLLRSIVSLSTPGAWCVGPRARFCGRGCRSGYVACFFTLVACLFPIPGIKWFGDTILTLLSTLARSLRRPLPPLHLRPPRRRSSGLVLRHRSTRLRRRGRRPPSPSPRTHQSKHRSRTHGRRSPAFLGRIQGRPGTGARTAARRDRREFLDELVREVIGFRAQRQEGLNTT